MKISTDGAILTNKKHGVQGCIKILEIDQDNKVVLKSSLPERFQKEIPLFYYIGKNT